MYIETARMIIAEHLGVDLDSVREDVAFAVDLGADSLDMIELAMKFEDEFNIVVEDDVNAACVTVGDALNLLAGKAAVSYDPEGGKAHLKS